MPIVVGGLGLPEDGALVAAGLGASGAPVDTLRARLAGTSDVLATLSDGSEPTPVTGGGGAFVVVSRIPRLQPRRGNVPAWAAARLSGSSSMTADIDFALDPDHLLADLAAALLLDLV